MIDKGLMRELDCVTPTWGDDWRPKAGPVRPLDADAVLAVPKHLITKEGRAIHNLTKTTASGRVCARILQELASGDWVTRDTLVLKIRCASSTFSASVARLLDQGVIERVREKKRTKLRLVPT